MDHIKKILTWANANKQKSVIIVVARYCNNRLTKLIYAWPI